MSFWSDASPVTKGAIVVGPILILIAAYFMWFAGGDEATTNVRPELSPPGAAAQ